MRVVAIKRPCGYPGCAELVAAGRCAKHASQAEQRRGKTAERGYGAEHKRQRVDCFVRDQWRCVDCGWMPVSVALCAEAGLALPPVDVVLEELRVAFARYERHLHADHEIPIEMRPELAHSLDNLRTRCNVCHSAKTAREDGGFGRAPMPAKAREYGVQAHETPSNPAVSVRVR